jgi:hypothetical protein
VPNPTRQTNLKLFHLIHLPNGIAHMYVIMQSFYFTKHFNHTQSIHQYISFYTQNNHHFHHKADSKSSSDLMMIDSIQIAANDGIFPSLEFVCTSRTGLIMIKSRVVELVYFIPLDYLVVITFNNSTAILKACLYINLKTWKYRQTECSSCTANNTRIGNFVLYCSLHNPTHVYVLSFHEIISVFYSTTLNNLQKWNHELNINKQQQQSCLLHKRNHNSLIQIASQHTQCKN